jgi:hypothetical protein
VLKNDQWEVAWWPRRLKRCFLMDYMVHVDMGGALTDEEIEIGGCVEEFG